jgi:endonuclease YncB( thermonuclease family)
MRRTVKKVIDGDTIVVNRKIGDTNKIRLARVNAPEKGRPGGKKATNILKGLIGGKSITLTPKGRSYDRVVAEVRVGRKSVNKRMNEKLKRK